MTAATAAVAPWMPYAAAFGPLLRSTISASPVGMSAAASMNQPTRWGSPPASSTKMNSPVAMSRTPLTVSQAWKVPSSVGVPGMPKREARRAAPAGALRAVCHAYLEFATARPALYQAMFVLPTDIKFASAETPPPLRAGFAEFVAVLPRVDDRRELRAEVIWSALHGIAVLSYGGRIPPGSREERLDILLAQVDPATV